MDSLRTQFPFPVYPIGPAIPYLELDQHNSSSSTSREEHDYFQWLNSQPSGSVLYISLGSFLSVSSAQMDEIAYGLCDSGVRFLWVARSEASRLKEICGDLGLVVPWCDQLKVLCHSSVGGFWTHCGWNSLLEAVFGGVPMLTFPLFLDQFPNSRQIVEDWKIGWRVERDTGNENLMKREEITKLVKRFMDHESSEGKEMRKRARELRDVCQRAIAKGGSSDENLDAFIRNICNTRPSSVLAFPITMDHDRNVKVFSPPPLLLFTTVTLSFSQKSPTLAALLLLLLSSPPYSLWTLVISPSDSAFGKSYSSHFFVKSAFVKSCSSHFFVKFGIRKAKIHLFSSVSEEKNRRTVTENGNNFDLEIVIGPIIYQIEALFELYNHVSS
ncbi:UDP-glycosyltransferase 87A2 [Morus notabilis]|uniref:UDP-glycosyltransferase 87A2 n=1 Tax=Morus notabilis TaxID=981085 RepID=W9RA20_9ROSA|nr:UDP-glycosyltransferase 87A2 [Morus notabilis]